MSAPSVDLFGMTHAVISAEEVEIGDLVGPTEVLVREVLHVHEGMDGDRLIAVHLTTDGGLLGAHPWTSLTIVRGREVAPRCGDTKRDFCGFSGRTVTCTMRAGHDGGHSGHGAVWSAAYDDPDDDDWDES